MERGGVKASRKLAESWRKNGAELVKAFKVKLYRRLRNSGGDGGKDLPPGHR